MSYFVKQNTALTVPVVMFGVDHSTEVVGCTLGNILVRAAWSDGTTAAVTPTSFTEVDSTNMKGLYMLGLPASAFNKPVGPVVFYITSSNPVSDLTKREFYITANLLDEVYYHAQRGHWILEGHWKIDTTLNRLIMYAPDGTTIIQQFNLLNSFGAPNSSSIYERSPQTPFT